MSTTFIRDNRDQYDSLNIDLPGNRRVKSSGAYHTPLIETVALTASTEGSLSLRTDVGLIRIVSSARASFSTGWVAAGSKMKTAAGCEYKQDEICKGNGPGTIYFESPVAATLTIETWLIGS